MGFGRVSDIIQGLPASSLGQRKPLKSWVVASLIMPKIWKP
jgi:hypothetical protein